MGMETVIGMKAVFGGSVIANTRKHKTLLAVQFSVFRFLRIALVRMGNMLLFGIVLNR